MMLHINKKTITTPANMNTLCICLLLSALSPVTNAFPTSTTARPPFAVRVPSKGKPKDTLFRTITHGDSKPTKT